MCTKRTVLIEDSSGSPIPRCGAQSRVDRVMRNTPIIDLSVLMIDILQVLVFVCDLRVIRTPVAKP